MSHEEFMKKMEDLHKRLAKAKGVEEIKALQKEIREVLASPRT